MIISCHKLLSPSNMEDYREYLTASPPYFTIIYFPAVSITSSAKNYRMHACTDLQLAIEIKFTP